MIAIIKAGTPQAQIDNLIRWLENQGLKIHISEGEYYTVWDWWVIPAKSIWICWRLWILW